jgi:hypothetical protein
MAAVSGDIVRDGEDERVVVDVTEDGWAVLRAKDDLELEEPAAKLVDELEVVGHLDGLDGWTETEHGVWEKTEGQA